MKRIAIMQPYLFPYLGYYQLVNAADKFVFYDDVNYIKGGYINRNNILSKDKALRFTLPVLSASSNKKINELYFSHETRKILQSIQQNYSKAPFFQLIFPIVESIICSEDRKVSELCKRSIEAVFDYIKVDIEFHFSQDIKIDRSKEPAQKLIDISDALSCEHYINPIGGIELYDKSFFSNQGKKLSFIKMMDVKYHQGNINEAFVSNLSMIDILMWNDVEQIKTLLSKYTLI